MSEISGVVLKVVAIPDRIVSLHIGASDVTALPSFKAGAHIEINVSEIETRAYSLISWDGNFDQPESYEIAVQREDAGDGGSRFMHGLSVGDKITFSAPKNDFSLLENSSAQLLAGGIGITPMISMARALKDADVPVQMTFAGRSKAEMAFVEELRDLLGSDLALHYDDEQGTLDLAPIIAELGTRHLYVCGPRGMIDAVRAKAEAAGLAPERIHFELFEAAGQTDGDTAFEVQINDGSVFTVPPGKSIIEILEENDVDVMYDCQRGDCGICQCDVLDGVPDHRDVVLSEAERAEGEVMQICVSRAKSARLVLDIEGA